MAEPIRMSALGRAVQVGDVYNYFTDAILPSEFHVPNEWKPTPAKKFYAFFYQQPDKFKGCMLGINSHLQNSIDQDAGNLNELWFTNYLKPNPSEGNDMARVDVFIKIVQQTEFLDQQFINSKMYEYKLNTGGLATHLVEEVVYGAEFICSMQRKVNQQETKESAEENLCKESKIYFDEIMSSNPMFTTPPIKWGDEVHCKIFSSLLKADDNMEGSFQHAISWLRKAINIDKENLVPVEILLRFIPEQIETRLQSEKFIDMRIDIDRNWHWIVLESGRISKIANLDRVYPLAKVICQFRDLLPPLWNTIEKCYANIMLVTVSSPDEGLKGFQPIRETLLAMTDWLVHRRNEIQFICSLLDGTNLVAQDLEDIETKTLTNDEKVAKVFVLKVDYNENPLVERIQNIVARIVGNHQTSVFKLPVFSITKFQEKLLLNEVRNKLHEFANEADLSRWGPNRETSYYIALVPNSEPNSSSLDDGTIHTIEYSDKASNTVCPLIAVDSINSFEKLQQNPLDGFTLINSKLPPPLAPTVVPTLNQQHIQIGNCEPLSATGSSSVTTNTNLDDHENQIGMDIDESSALSSDLEITEDAGSNNTTANSKDMVQFFAKTETQNSNKTEIEPNAAAISGNADAEQDLSVHKTEKMKVNDVAEETPSRTASTAADFIQNIFVTGGKQTKQRSDRNDRETYVGQTNLKLDRYESSSQSNPERHAKNRSDSSREETDGTTKDGERSCKVNTDKDDTKQVRNYGDKRSGMQHEEFPSNRRVAEIFLDASEQFSTSIKKGLPNVYLLNAEQTSTSEDFRWFDIGQSNNSTLPSKNHRNHKVIILMGATGCGKSTLINGMVNYILGVKWNDPFRFECVRDDEKTVKNQAHSQTSTVTAYTLRHHNGMAVPYSITIIDTPGYGDTRGVSRDKLITRNIHQFLTQQGDNRVDQIHAACFVVASGDSRLTATQRYIIDSVLSIFGKDVKENMRLLVTFADNADPPVVEACLAANFPVTSTSAGITYSKFNSSVLYASNIKHEEDDFGFDELFWDMGQENFYKFFTMLEKMNGRNLKSTREVIQRRDLLEQSLKDIEQELEVCLVNIENMEMFRRKMREYGHKMETNKNFVVEKTEMRYVQIKCDKGFKAYNCHRCKRTCEPRVKEFKKRACTSSNCPCPITEHEFQTFEWQPRSVMIKTTLLDIKAEYESNYDDKMTTEQLLANCLIELDVTKAKVLSLLDQVGINARKLDSTALRSNALSPADYLSLMRSRVAEEQAPGYLTRLETLTELQQRLAGIIPKRQTQTFTTPGSHRGEMSKQHNSTIRQENNCWKEAKTNQQSEVHQQEEQKGTPKPPTKYFGFIPKWK